MTNDSDEMRKIRQEASAVRRLIATRKEEALLLRSQVEELTAIYAEVEAGKDVDPRRLSGYGVVLVEPASPLDRLVARVQDRRGDRRKRLEPCAGRRPK